MTRIVDTTVRLLSQQPLHGYASTATVLEVAEILDGAGFAGLEVSGGGCFDAAVRRGVESPWDRIRALRARCTRTPLQIAVRGRFLVGSKPVSDDLVRRFILSAAESGIDVFRLHDPLNDVENLAAAAAAVREAGGRLYGGLAFSGQMGNLERVIEKARRLAELGAERVLLHDSAGALDPGTAGNVVERLSEAAGVPAGLYCQGTGGKALAMAVEAARHGAEPVAVAAYPVASLLNRVSAEVLCEALTGLGLEHGVDVDRVWDASRFIDAHVTSRMPALPVPPRIILRTAISRLPVGLVADIDARLRAADSLDRLDEALTELNRGARRLRHGAAGAADRRHPRRPGRHPRADRAPLGRGVRRDAGAALGRVRHAAAALRARRPPRMPSALPLEPDTDMDDLRSQAGGVGSEEDLLLLALFGDDAARLLDGLRGRADAPGEAVDHSQSERVRELIRLLEASDVGELTVDEGGVQDHGAQAGRAPGRTGARRAAARPGQPRPSPPCRRRSGSSRRWWAPSTARRRPPSPPSWTRATGSRWGRRCASSRR